LKFKAGGKTITADGGLLEPIRLVGALIAHEMHQNAKRHDQTSLTQDEKTLTSFAEGKLAPPVTLAMQLKTGQDMMGRTLPWSDKPNKYRDQQKYTWKEWALSQGSIPIASAAENFYNQLRQQGFNHTQAGKIINAAITWATGMIGVHATDDRSVQKKGRK
jgi:hypothetical protein